MAEKPASLFWAADDVCDDVHGGHEVLFIFLKPFLGPRGPLIEPPMPACLSATIFLLLLLSRHPGYLNPPVTSVVVFGPPLANDHPEGPAS